jgi:diguanylate cyclase (GGDEF)-like protein/PAS domain S-box-containing protein
MPRWRKPRLSLSGWARAGITAGFLVTFASVAVSITDAQSLSASYEQAIGSRSVQDDNDDFRNALLQAGAGLNAYARDAEPASEAVYITAEVELTAVRTKFQDDAAAYGLTWEISSLLAAFDVWQSWATNLKSTIDMSAQPIDDPARLTEGSKLFQVAITADDRYETAAQDRIQTAVSSAQSERDRLLTESIERGVVAALLLIGLGLWLSRGVLVPVSRLASTARDLAAGKAIKIPVSKRTDEIGDLSRALAAWQASRTDRERLFDLSADMFCVAAGGYFKVINATWEKVTGLTRAELMATPYLDRYHPDDRRDVLDQVARIRAGASAIGFRARFACKDGSYRWLEWSVSPATEDGLAYGVARDITGQVSAEEALRASGEQIRSIIDNVADGIVTLDQDGRLQSVNPLVETVFGYGPGELIGQSVAVLIAEPNRTDFLAHLQSYLRPDKKQVRSGSHETVGQRKDGTTFPLEFIGSQIQTGQQRVFIGTLRDITERKTERDMLEHRLLYDALTSLPNRALFMERLREEIRHTQAHGRRWGLAIMDLDRFKEVNESLGHEQGDRLLVAVAGRVAGALTSSSRIARMGGDEFAIWSSVMSDPEAASRRATQILDALDEPFTIGDRKIDVRASMGVAIFPEHGHDLDTLMRHADIAMYLAKRRQAGFTIYSPADDDAQPGARLAIRGEVRHALNHDEFALEYMPIIGLRSNDLESVEALIRWHHPERGLIMPGDFIPPVEETELINPLTRWVLEKSARQFQTWRRRGLPAAVSANLSSVKLEDKSLAAWLERALRLYDLDPSWLILEITETSAMKRGAANVIHALDQLGVRISVDDFGTGYSSLSALQRLPLDLIKIDRSFVGEMLTSQGAASIVRSVIDLAHNLGLQAVAEAVENDRTEALLRELGCDYAQGFHISRPLPAELAGRWIARHLEQAA